MGAEKQGVGMTNPSVNGMRGVKRGEGEGRIGGRVKVLGRRKEVEDGGNMRMRCRHLDMKRGWLRSIRGVGGEGGIVVPSIGAVGVSGVVGAVY